ncbi:Hypothetical predicted protein [Paramuricea clavata]|uniref:Uncharacterized protein n=1 Tax=Paramuricea clavata TaxID=317549 RepID=A0A7D9KVB3_PARCT|nr:Hypothetical predicted protein [Paramuricea clavata]
MLFYNPWFAVNSRGEIIVIDEEKITVIYSTGESKDVMFPDPTENNVIDQCRMDVAVDSNDNVYAVRWLNKRRDKNGSDKKDFELCAYDKNYNIKHVSVLDFLGGDFGHVKITVDKNQNLIIMLTNWNDQVYICETTGKLKYQFKRDEDYLRSLSISNNKGIMIESDDLDAVQIRSTEEKLQQCYIKDIAVRISVS